MQWQCWPSGKVLLRHCPDASESLTGLGQTTPLRSQSLVKKWHRINDLEGCFGVFYGLKEL